MPELRSPTRTGDLVGQIAKELGVLCRLAQRGAVALGRGPLGDLASHSRVLSGTQVDLRQDVVRVRRCLRSRIVANHLAQQPLGDGHVVEPAGDDTSDVERSRWCERLRNSNHRLVR